MYTPASICLVCTKLREAARVLRRDGDAVAIGQALFAASPDPDLAFALACSCARAGEGRAPPLLVEAIALGIPGTGTDDALFREAVLASTMLRFSSRPLALWASLVVVAAAGACSSESGDTSGSGGATGSSSDATTTTGASTSSSTTTSASATSSTSATTTASTTTTTSASTTGGAGGGGGFGGAGGAGGQDCVDADGDTYTDAACGGTDCDDGDGAVHPGVVEADDWQLEIVQSGGVYTDVRMVLGPNDEPHIVYFDALSNGQVAHAVKLGGVWTFDVPAPVADAFRNPVVAIDAAGHVHVAYFAHIPNGLLSGDLRYVTNATGSYVMETVDTVSDVRYEPSIFVDTTGVVHLSYSDSTSGEQRYARREQGVWKKEDVDQSATLGGESQIDAKDPAAPTLVYNQTFQNLHVTVRGAAGWSKTLIYNTGFPGIGLSFDLDDSGHRHYAHFDLQSGDLLHTYDAPAWTTETVAPLGIAASRPTAIASHGGVTYIAYPGADDPEFDEAVYVAKNKGGTWATERVMQHIDDYTIAAHTSIAANAAGQIFVSSPRQLDSLAPSELVLLSRLPTDGVDVGCNGE